MDLNIAGKRQNFIPQFLQNEFSSHVKGKETFTWVYHKGRDLTNPNIKNVGVEGLFYSEKEDHDIDMRITLLEKSFNSLLMDLRTQNIENIDSARIASNFSAARKSAFIFNFKLSCNL